MPHVPHRMADDDDDEDLPPEDYDEPAAFDPQDETMTNRIKGHFLTELIVQDTDGTNWILDEPLVYQRVCGEVITVPAGFDTDLASVPRIFWRVFPPSGVYNKAAVVHDWLYVTRKIGPRIVCRDEADAVLLEAMDYLGVGWLERTTMYRCVRMFGWIVWNRRLIHDRK